MRPLSGADGRGIEAVLRSAPGDVELQIGGATLPDQDPLAPEEDGGPPMSIKVDNQAIVGRLEVLARPISE